jgi:prophage regulatory protein
MRLQPNWSLNMSDKILRLPQVINTTGLSKASIYRLEQSGSFPKRFSLSPGAVGWKDSQIREWIEQREPVSG